MPSAVTIVAPAKLTIGLRITGLRADGYHLLDAEMVTLALHDTLTITPDGTGITVDGPYAAGVPLDASNLVAKALVLCERRAAVHIHKQIPHGGGLGGGSANAAAILRWAGWDDLHGASQLGADVPFCVAGGRARVRGIGEIVEPLPFDPFEVTLVTPPLQVSTPAAYRAWDQLGAVHADGDNDLEPAALAVVPAMERWRDRITAASGRRPSLAGSGATWFLRGHHPALVETFPEASVVLTSTADRQR